MSEVDQRKEEQQQEKSIAEVYYLTPKDDAIARNLDSGVKLTKFSPLPVEVLQQHQHYVNRYDVNNKTTQENSSRSNTNVTTNSDNNNNNKWPWFSNIKCSTLDSLADMAPTTISGQEPFQIVWENLSFDVSLNVYDRVINRIGKSKRTPQRNLNDMNSNLNSRDKLNNLSTIDFSHLQDDMKLNTNYNSSKRTIFENLNGYISSGEITAILGPSGSGKTSLLNAICGKVDNYRGRIKLVGGGERRMRLSIIPQKDFLLGNLTVRESLRYSSLLLNTSKNFDHDQNIAKYARQLNLLACFDSSISHISGGEYKRVSIAQELMRQPDILILDEPTSGLDSLNCKNLINSLRNLVEASRKGSINQIAVVMTIHQPDVDLLSMFDHIYCLARGGKFIFDGHPSKIMDVLKSQASGCSTSLQLACKTSDAKGMGINPANLLIEIASVDIYGQEIIERLSRYQRKQFDLRASGLLEIPVNDEKKNLTKQLIATVLEAEKQQASHVNIITTEQQTNQAIRSNNEQKNLTLLSNSSSWKSESFLARKENQLVRDKRLNAKNDHQGQFWRHTNILARRAFTSTIRDPLLTMISLMFHLTIPFVMWICYSQDVGKVKACPVIQRDMDMISMVSNQTMEKLESLQSDMAMAMECSTMFFLTKFSFSNCAIAVAALAFPLNMHVLLKEVRNGWYGLKSYVVANSVASFPFVILFPVVSLILIYVMLGMPPSYLEWRLWAVALAMALTSLISHTQGLIFGALCMDSVQTAIFLALASTLPLTLLSGFTARINHMPRFLQHLSWFSLYRYSTDSINIIRFGYGTCPCDDLTEDYLRTKVPNFSDLPQSVKPLFTYYMTNTASDQANSEATTIGSTLDLNATIVETVNSTLTTVINSTSNLINELSSIPGVSNDLTLNQLDRAVLVSKIEVNEIDLFKRLADLMSRSFTYGREMTSCESVRSQLLALAGTPSDSILPYLFLGMFVLLVVAKVALFLIVKNKIASRL